MNYNEAKEHAPGRLHQLLDDPYQAFDNETPERQEHLSRALHVLLDGPLRDGTLTLRVIHGWENGSFDPASLRHSDHTVQGLGDIRRALEAYLTARAEARPIPADRSSLLQAPLDDAIRRAEDAGQPIDEETRRTPARWPAFEQGLYLYTFFKVYNRLTYGEDDSYRSVHCQTPDGECEIHEFHLEEGEFAIVAPGDEHAESPTLLILHESQLEPMIQLLERCGVAIFRR